MPSEPIYQRWRALVVYAIEPAEPQATTLFVEYDEDMGYLAHHGDCLADYEHGQCACDDWSETPIGAVAVFAKSGGCIAVEIAPPGGLFQHEAVERARAPLVVALYAALEHNRACKEDWSLQFDWFVGGGKGIGHATGMHMAQEERDRARMSLQEALASTGLDFHGEDGLR